MKERHTPSESHSSSMRGSTLLYGILLLVAVGALGAALSGTGARSTFGQLRENRRAQAYYVALSGLNYARYIGGTALVDPTTLTLSGNQSVVLDKTDTGSWDVTGTIDGGTGSEANFVFGSILIPAKENNGWGWDDEGGDEGGGGDGDATSDFALFSGSGGDTNIPNQGDIDGSVYGGNVTLENQSEVTGNVQAESNVTLINQSSVGGYICAGGSVTLQNQTEVAGDVDAQTSVFIGSNNATVDGSVRSAGSVTMANQSLVKGNIDASGDVTLGSNNSEVGGNVVAGGNVTLDSNTIARGDISSKGNVFIGWNALVEGDIVATGDVTVDGGTVQGNITCGGLYTDGWATDVQGVVAASVVDPGVLVPEAPHACPTVSVPPQQSYTAGGTSVSPGWKEDSDNPILPGTYASLTTGGKNDIYFTCGEYYFSSINIAWDAVIHYDLYDNSAGKLCDISIFVVGDVLTNGKLDIKVSTNTLNDVDLDDLDDPDKQLAAYVYWESHSTFQTGTQTDWFGTIYADGNLTFGDQNDFIGAYYSKNGIPVANNQFDLTYVQSNFAKEHWK